MTTERDDGHGPYIPQTEEYVKAHAMYADLGTQRIARELLHLRERTATLESQLSEQAHQIIEWKSASGLSDSSGDPGGIEPRHLARRIREDDSRHRLLLRVIDSERKAHASTALARDAACAKVAVMERLEAWLRLVPIESSTNSVAIGLDYANDGNIITGLFDENGDLAECSSSSLTDAIDAALREVE